MDEDRDAAKRDTLSRANLRGLAQFGYSIDGDGATGDEGFAGAAAVADTHELEQLVELDVFAGQFEVVSLHRNILAKAG